MEKIGYGRIIMSKELLDDLYKMQTIHAVFSGIVVMSITYVYNLTNDNKPVKDTDLKYIEYFCKSPHFYKKENDDCGLRLHSETPYFAFRMETVDDSITGDVFRKRFDITWFEVEHNAI